MQPKRWFIVLLPALLLSGCSALPRYVISNNSGEIVVIKYSYPAQGKQGIGSCPIKKLRALPETTLDKLANERIAWQKLSTNNYVFDDRECSVKVAIIAGASVTVAMLDPFKKTAAALSKVDPALIQLDLQNERDSVRLSGADIFKRFEQKGERLYVYDFP